jgi:hypothetical protein
VLELIAADEFPGSQRYIGLGQLPSEALRLLWPSRKPVTPAQLNAWNALASDDPQPLATIARSGTPALPIMASALHRHLRELPSVENVPRLTQHLALQILSEGGAFTLNRVWHLLQTEPEPLPWIGDLGLLQSNRCTKRPSLFSAGFLPRPVRAHFFSSSASPTSAAVLRGERDWHSLRPPSRWVGGVHNQPGVAGWRWDDAKHDAVFQQ